MTAPDAPQVEPLTLPLEEALARIGERGYTLAVYHHEDAPEYVLHDVYSAFAQGSFGHWKDAVEAVLGVPVVPRDEAAELREENHTLRTEADGWLKRVELLEAAIREWVEATSDAEMFELDQSNAYGTDHADAEYRVEAAAQALRRLAGGGES